MKDLVSNRRVSILAAAAALSILWAIVVVWSGQRWAGYVWVGSIALLLVSATVLFLDAARSTTLATVIRGVEEEPRGKR